MNCDVNNLARLSSCLRCLTDAQLMQTKTYLLCQWFSKASAGTPNAPTNPDIASDFVAGGIQFSWTNPSPKGTTNEIWKSTDGITFNLFSTVAGSASSFNDNVGIVNQIIWYYKVRSCNGSSCSAFTNPVGVAVNFTSPNVASIGLPNLIRVIGNFIADGLALLTSVSMPALKSVSGNLDLANNANLTSITLTSLSSIITGGLLMASNKITGAFSLPALVSTGQDLQVQSNTLMTSFSAPLLTAIGNIGQFASCTGLTSVSMNSLQTVANLLLFDGDSALTSLSLPALVSVANDFTFPNCTSLTSASFPALTTLQPQNFFSMNGSGCTLLSSLSIPVLASVLDGFTFTMNACALNAASVNLVLHRGLTWAVVGTDFELGAGTNAAPSGQGVADKATLQGQGNTCNTN